MDFSDPRLDMSDSTCQTRHVRFDWSDSSVLASDSSVLGSWPRLMVLDGYWHGVLGPVLAGPGLHHPGYTPPSHAVPGTAAGVASAREMVVGLIKRGSSK